MAGATITRVAAFRSSREVRQPNEAPRFGSSRRHYRCGVRVAFIGGTHLVGPVAVPLLLKAGHEVAVAHTGAHEQPAVADAEHLHAPWPELLDEGGPIERWSPDALVDTFARGANGDAAATLRALARRAGVSHVVVVSSMDVYAHCIHAGVGAGTGVVAMPPQPFPITEDAPLRVGPYPGAPPGHDNAAMEAEVGGAERVTILRPGAIYGPYTETRERYFVERVRDGIAVLELPDRGQQFFHRVAVERVARAVVAAFEHAPAGTWACNVVDPYDWTFAGLAGEIGRLLEWEWEPVCVPFNRADHPWALAHPIIGSDTRLREVLHVVEPEPRDALAETIAWLWDHRHNLVST
jgi:nucleoside-diphosphate-sugar epimerase